ARARRACSRARESAPPETATATPSPAAGPPAAARALAARSATKRSSPGALVMASAGSARSGEVAVGVANLVHGREGGRLGEHPVHGGHAAALEQAAGELLAQGVFVELLGGAEELPGAGRGGARGGSGA